ncbi:unnamed protein product [Arabidopsis arenosa]|uniref:Small EDRK-rich factor-like N-terminal domain-containing protein n=1 Tax=Arabidopsis arenosa TaxID=38785 RepID=A0A8S2B515_ARAAE|nr:unnamed protein product [Arabidopsis arenosa]
MTHILLILSLLQSISRSTNLHNLFRRERDRERAAARAGGKGKNAEDGLTPEQRRERDGKALQEKAAKKAAQAAAAGSGGGAGSKGAAKK